MNSLVTKSRTEVKAFNLSYRAHQSSVLDIQIRVRHSHLDEGNRERKVGKVGENETAGEEGADRDNLSREA